MSLIKLSNISKDFVQGSETINALKKTNFEANAGELVAIIGPSGSGKSTFLTIIGGLQTPTSGEVFINNVSYSNKSELERSKLRFKDIGFILQASNLIPFLTVKEQLHLYNNVTKTKIDKEKCKNLLNELDIYQLRDKYPNELSGGERQRVAIAKALYHEPSLILADEPTASLDSKKAFEVVKLLSKETKEHNKTTIMVTHDERLIEYCDSVYTIEDGILTKTK